jgi:hypothetical protein
MAALLDATTSITSDVLNTASSMTSTSLNTATAFAPGFDCSRCWHSDRIHQHYHQQQQRDVTKAQTGYKAERERAEGEPEGTAAAPVPVIYENEPGATIHSPNNSWSPSQTKESQIHRQTQLQPARIQQPTSNQQPARIQQPITDLQSRLQMQLQNARKQLPDAKMIASLPGSKAEGGRGREREQGKPKGRTRTNAPIISRRKRKEQFPGTLQRLSPGKTTPPPPPVPSTPSPAISIEERRWGLTRVPDDLKQATIPRESLLPPV